MIWKQSKQLTAAFVAIDALAGAPEDGLPRAVARGLLRGYDARWRAACSQWRPEAIEEEFCAPVYNLKARSRVSRSRTFRVAGKKDLRARDSQGDSWVWDHKTTSSDIAAPDAVFWRQLAVSGQASLYPWSEHLLGRTVMGAMWDAIRKPDIRPKGLTKAEQKAVTSLGEYFGNEVSEAAKQHVVQEGRENEELYEFRLGHDCQQRPHHYFQRRQVLRLEHEMAEYVNEVWELALEIRECRRRDRHLRNSGACLTYNTPCTYLGICSGYDSPDSDKWRRRENVHEELSTINGDSRDVLTHSRLACFQTCRRKHYYRYELGIERVDAKRSEALFLGTIVHAGLAAWWSSAS